MLNTNWQSLEYSARTKLMDLAEEFAETRKRDRREKIIDQAATIRYYLKAVELKTTYLEDDAVNAIYQCLIDVAEINNYPTVPILAAVTTPDIGTTIIVQGTPGERGEDGGATDFEIVGAAIDTIVDTFAVTDAYGARWDYVISDGTNQRQGTISTTWLSDGTIASPAHYSSDDIGDVTPVTISINYLAGQIRLFAAVTSGIWSIRGSRYFIPNSGAFQGISGGSSALADANIFIGNASNIAVANPVTGDISLSNTGVTAIASGVIVNGDISGSAAISVSKLAALTATRAVVSDSSGFLTTVAVTPTELGYVAGVTSAIQTQLDSKLSAATGAISTVVSSDLTINRAVISNASGKIAVSNVTSTELGYVSGVTSAIQIQLDGKVNDTGDTMTGALVNTTTIEAQGGIRTASSGDYLKTKIINIGDWNMDSVLNIEITHGLTGKNIRSISVIIRNDFDTDYDLLDSINTSGVVQGGVENVWNSGAGNIVLRLFRTTGGKFDSVGYDATSYNRGWITITYIA